MEKYNIQFFDLDTGVPSATLADYGITLNAAATKMLDGWKYARIGLDKNRRVVVLKPHNDDQDAVGCLRIRPRGGQQQYFRVNSKDLVRVVAKCCGIPLEPSTRCLVEWDSEEQLLVIDPKATLGSRRGDLRGKEGKPDARLD